MKESAQAALYVCPRARRRARASRRTSSRRTTSTSTFPRARSRRTGRRPGITIATAIISVLTGRPVRRNVAMTGEITLRGDVLPIGGVKEKVLAARAAKLNTFILPKLNERDLVDVPEPIKRDMSFHFVEHVEDVLKIALLEKDAAEQKTTERAGRENHPLPEPEPATASPEQVPVLSFRKRRRDLEMSGGCARNNGRPVIAANVLPAEEGGK